jgi:hypothetical protein
MGADAVHDEGGEVLERILARGLVVGGGLFWAVLAVGTTLIGPYGALVSATIKYAAIPLLAAAVIFAIGWRYERLAAILLFVATAAVAAFGLVFAWEPGQWLFMFATLIGPMFMSGTMYYLASRNESKRAEAKPAE